MDSFQSVGRQFEMSMPPVWTQSIFKLYRVVAPILKTFQINSELRENSN